MRTHSVTTFYVFAFAISWLGFVPVLAAAAGVAFFKDPLWKLGLILPGCGPAVAAGLTRRLAGESGDAVSSLRAAMRWRVSPRWYIAAVLLPAALLLAAQGVSRLLFPQHNPILPALPMAGVLSLTLMSLAANPWEEVGWRGFATTRLQAQYNGLITAVVVGALWGVWHIPLLLWPESPMSNFPFWPWFMSVLGEAGIIAWLYNSANQSVAIAAIFHVMFNVFGAIIGIHSHTALAIVNLVLAAVLAWRYGVSLGLERHHRVRRA